MVKPNCSATDRFWFILIFIYFIIIGYFVCSSTYLFTDEAFNLWHNDKSGFVFNIYASQGRYLTGFLFEWSFREFNTIEQIKWIRFFSLAGWLFTVICIFYMLKKMLRDSTDVSKSLVYSLLFFISASLTFIVCISWAVCSEIFLACLLSFYSGYALFMCLRSQTGRIHIPTLVYIKVILPGIAALFLYQSLFPIMLFPFFVLFLADQSPATIKKIRIVLFFHVFIYALYFALFRYSLHSGAIVASSRTDLQLSPMQKIAFFFSFPLNQAFNINIPFDARSAVSQLVFPVIAVAWLLSLFVNKRREKKSGIIYYVVYVFIFWVLAFLPQLITAENFGPYRTMLVLSLMVFTTLVQTIYSYLDKEITQLRVCFCSGIILLMIAVFNYNHFICRPLQFEFQTIRKYIAQHYSPDVRQIIVIRPAENGFEQISGTENYKDELGMPSTSKDWTCEPLVRQIIYELGIPRKKVSEIAFMQYTEKEKSGHENEGQPTVLYVDIPLLLKK